MSKRIGDFLMLEYFFPAHLNNFSVFPSLKVTKYFSFKSNKTGLINEKSGLFYTWHCDACSKQLPSGDLPTNKLQLLMITGGQLPLGTEGKQEYEVTSRPEDLHRSLTLYSCSPHHSVIEDNVENITGCSNNQCFSTLNLFNHQRLGLLENV